MGGTVIPLRIPPVSTHPDLYHGKYVASLFASGEQGVWYDPSDLSTLFQDTAGTIPITSPLEKPVGLMLDKRNGVETWSNVGSELLTNGDFSSATGWNPYGTGISISGGKLNFSSASKDFGYNQSKTIKAGMLYQVVIVIDSMSAGQIAVFFGDTSYPAERFNSAGTYTTRIRSATANTKFYVTSNIAGTTAVIDSVSLKVVTEVGNHAYQSTTTSRPTLSARYNLLTKTEQFDDAAWVKNVPLSVVSKTEIAPDGTASATRVTSATAANIYQTIQNSVGQTFKVWVKSATATNQTFLMFGNRNQYFTKTATTSWQLFECSPSLIGSDGWWGLQLGSSVPNDLLIWHPDIRPANDGIGLPAYQRVNTATDFAVDGFPAAEVFDGVDDHEITAAGGGSTTAFFWCSSIRVGKVGAVQTLFSDTGTNTGYRVRINASNQLELAAGNGSAYTTATTSDTLALGQRAVLTAWHDGTNLNVQINNGTVVQAAFATATAGTAQITIGKDNNAASSYFMGRLYEKVYLKDTVVSASNITATKNYCANKAKITL